MTSGRPTARPPGGQARPPRRARTTSRRVRWGDRTARVAISLGGVGTIVAVSGVLVFLVSVVVPLFASPEVRARPVVGLEGAAALADPLHLGVDEYQGLLWAFHPDGRLRVHRVDTGALVEERRPLGDAPPTSACFAGGEAGAAVGLADGTVRLGRMAFESRFVDLPAELRPLRADPERLLAELARRSPEEAEGALLSVTEKGDVRRQALTVGFDDPLAVDPGHAILAVDRAAQPAGSVVASLSAAGTLTVSVATQRTNLITRKVSTRVRSATTTVDLSRGPPRWLRLTGLGDCVFLIWEDGRLERYDTRTLDAVKRVERLDLLGEPGARVTATGFLVGRTSLVVGDSRGRVRVWFRIRPAFTTSPDDSELVLAREFAPGSAAVTALAASSKERLLATGHADGSLSVWNVTTGRLLATLESALEAPIDVLAFGPKVDSLFAAAGGRVASFDLRAPHADVSAGAIFRPVWYEGYERPEHVWQSSSGSDEFEAKFGLWPLVFGTLKATFYSLLFGLPLALLAAVYTSEFLHPRTRARIKPTIEVMASLPSVVLGFLAALVVAPFVEDVVPAVLLAFLAIPFAALLGAHLWRLLPASLGRRWERWRPAGMLAALGLGGGLAALFGPLLEDLLFAGDLKRWLSDHAYGSAAGGLFLLCLPIVGLATAVLFGRGLVPGLRPGAGSGTHQEAASAGLWTFLAATAATVAGAGLLAGGLALLGADLRGGLVDTYVQRNAMVVGFLMGFAIIPIIYTIAEDALSAVPEHLRAASIASGATRWQTATRIVIPTALSGIFSATMIGLGRAVGETMIVLMAAGNTPVLDWNVFSGFRTLAANIAVELPEAVKESTHYRMLFLAALVLFVMTFVLNTVAEVVRLRFRRRAFEL